MHGTVQARHLGAVLGAALLVGCGTKGPPHAPQPGIPAPVRSLALRQSGTAFELTWRAPEKRMDGKPLEGPLRYEVLARVVERPAIATPQATAAAQRTTTTPLGTAPTSSGTTTTATAGQQQPRATAQSRATLTSEQEERFFKSAVVVARISGDAGAGQPAGESPEKPTGTAGEPNASDTSRHPGKALGFLLARVAASQFAGVRLPGARLQFAVVAYDARGRRSRTRPVLEIDPVAPVPRPEAFQAVGTIEGVRLTWTVATAGGNAPGTAPTAAPLTPAQSPTSPTSASSQASGEPSVLATNARAPAPAPSSPTATPTPTIGVNIYRRVKDAHASAQEPTEAPPEQRTAQPADHEAGLGDRGDGVLLAGSPFQGTEALDGTAELGVTYLYRARAVSLAPGVGLRESEATDEQSVDYQDRFAPDPPALVTADAVMEAKPDAAAGQPSLAIRVSWSPPVASDLGGYRIERASGTEAFTAIGSVAASGIAWVDWDVTPGVTYRYRVVALDGANPPNASAPSAEAEAAATIETE